MEDLTGLLNSGKDIDDISVGRDFKKDVENKNKTDNDINNETNKEIPIPKLYYKNNFYLYMIRTDKREGVTIFQTYNILKLPIRVNTQTMEYYPILALNDFWSMDSELTQINKTENGFFTFRLYLSFNYIRNFMFSNMVGIQINEQMMYEKLKISGTKDMLVELIRNNSTFYLIILFTVNTLHTIFSYLGFSSDISYYKNLKKLDGVYTKYIFFNIFYMFITLIYILLQGANFIVKVELFISFVIEIWKLKKIFKISFEFNNFPYIIKLEYKQTFEQEEAKDYESEAVSMMVKYLLMPIGVLYLGYRIYYYSDNIIKNNWILLTKCISVDERGTSKKYDSVYLMEEEYHDIWYNPITEEFCKIWMANGPIYCASRFSYINNSGECHFYEKYGLTSSTLKKYLDTREKIVLDPKLYSPLK